MKTVITIMAHKEAQSTFDRHLPHWARMCGPKDDMLVAFPSNSKVMVPQGAQGLEVGLAAHTGVQSIIRMKTILEHLAGMNADRYVFFEYDSICLGKELPDLSTHHVACPVFTDDGLERGFLGKMFCHPPIMFSGHGMQTVAKQWSLMSNDAEKSVWDRYFGRACELAGIQPFNMLAAGLAYSHNTIHPQHYESMEGAIRRGAVFIHGIKDEETLKRALRAREFREKHLDIVNAGLHSPEDFETKKPN